MKKVYIYEFVDKDKRTAIFGKELGGLIGSVIDKKANGITHIAVVEAVADGTNIMTLVPIYEIPNVFTQSDVTEDSIASMTNHMNLIKDNYVLEVLNVDNLQTDPNEPMKMATILYYVENNKIVTHELGEGYIEMHLSTIDANLKGAVIASEMINKQAYVEHHGTLEGYVGVEEASVALTDVEKKAIRDKFTTVLDWLNNPSNNFHETVFGQNKLDTFKFVQFEFDRGLILEYNSNRAENRRFTIAKCDVGSITSTDIMREVSFINKPLDEIDLEIARMSKNSLFLGVKTAEKVPVENA